MSNLLEIYIAFAGNLRIISCFGIKTPISSSCATAANVCPSNSTSTDKLEETGDPTGVGGLRGLRPGGAGADYGQPKPRNPSLVKLEAGNPSCDVRKTTISKHFNLMRRRKRTWPPRWGIAYRCEANPDPKSHEDDSGLKVWEGPGD